VHAAAQLAIQSADGFAQRLGESDCSSWAVESGQQTVAGVFQLNAAETFELTTRGGVVAAIRSRHRESPSALARALEPTMSLNSGVARIRSLLGTLRAPVSG
jgi:hypothetical protein